MPKHVVLEGQIAAWIDGEQVRISITNPHLPEPVRFSSRTSTDQGKLLANEMQRQRVAAIAATGIPVTSEGSTILLRTHSGVASISLKGNVVSVEDSHLNYGEGDVGPLLEDASNVSAVLLQLGWPRYNGRDTGSLTRALELLGDATRVTGSETMLDMGLINHVQVIIFGHRIHLVAVPENQGEIEKLDVALGSLPVNLIMDLRGTELEYQRRERSGFGKPSTYARSTSDLIYGSGAEEIFTDAEGRIFHVGDYPVSAQVNHVNRGTFQLSDVRRGRTGAPLSKKEAAPMLKCLAVIESGKESPDRYVFDGQSALDGALQVVADVFAELMPTDALSSIRAEDVERGTTIEDFYISLRASINAAGMLVLKVVDHNEDEYLSTVLLASDITTDRVRTLTSYGLDQFKEHLRKEAGRRTRS